MMALKSYEALKVKIKESKELNDYEIFILMSLLNSKITHMKGWK